VIKQPAIPKSFIYTMIAISILSIVFGVVSLFVPPNPYFGIRTSKTLTSIEAWRRVNTISGIGFIILGILFTFLFARDLKKVDDERDKSFSKNFILSVILMIAWSIILAIFASIV